MKRILNLGLCLFLMLGAANIQGVKAANSSEIIKNDSTGIPDKALYQTFLDEGDINNDGIITKEEAKQIQNFNARDKGISNLKGLEYLGDLHELDLSNNNIQDISPLRNLEITVIRLNNNRISDLSPLRNLKPLNIWLNNNKITDISPLKDLDKDSLLGVSLLCLSNNSITDITPLENYKHLDFLLLSNNKISNISALGKVSYLKNLSLSGNNISDFSPLQSISNLQSLNISGRQIKNINFLSKLTELNSLSINDTEISDISVIGSLTKLTDLDLYNNRISNIQPLCNLKNLSKLSLADNYISNINPIQNLNNLFELNLSYNSINDISALGKLNTLHELNLTRNNIRDIMVLGNLSSLDILYVKDNSIRYLPKLNIFMGEFSGNWITEDELKKKLPSSLTSDQEWLAENKYVEPMAYNIKAEPNGKNRVKLVWQDDKSYDADGYIIYRKVGNGKFEYRYILDNNNNSFIDTTASETEYNFYKVYPYYYVNDERVIAKCKGYAYAKGILPAVSSLKATPAGKKKVTVTWSKVPNAEGYVIYRKVGNGKFAYRYMVKGTSFTDTTASKDDFNFYRIYPYYTEKGKKVFGLSNDYKYAKGVLKAVTNLKATTAGKNRVKITWGKSAGAEGYIVYRKVGNGKFSYRYIVKGTSFTDTTASNTDYNFYRIYPYYTENGKQVVGDSNDYKYAKGSLR